MCIRDRPDAGRRAAEADARRPQADAARRVFAARGGGSSKVPWLDGRRSRSRDGARGDAGESDAGADRGTARGYREVARLEGSPVGRATHARVPASAAPPVRPGTGRAKRRRGNGRSGPVSYTHLTLPTSD